MATTGGLMVPCPWAREAAERFAGLDIGIHLTLTAEYPAYRWRSLTGAPSLRDAQGYLPRSAAELWSQADVTDVEAEDFTVPVSGNTDRDHDHLGHDPMIHPSFAVGGVEEHVRVRLPGEVAVCSNLLVEVSADA